MPKALFSISLKTKGSSEEKICTGESRFNELMKLHLATRSKTIKFYVASSLKVFPLQAWIWYTKAPLLLPCLQPSGREEKNRCSTNVKQWDFLQGNSNSHHKQGSSWLIGLSQAGKTLCEDRQQKFYRGHIIPAYWSYHGWLLQSYIICFAMRTTFIGVTSNI